MLKGRKDIPILERTVDKGGTMIDISSELWI